MSKIEYATAPGYDPTTPWRSARYCVLDLETTGLDPVQDEIISYAAVPIDEGRIHVAGVAEGLVRPTVPIPISSILIHGIRPLDVKAAPPLADVLPSLVSAMTGRVLVVHVDWVERGFLKGPLSSVGLRLREPVLDTARLARGRFPELKTDTVGLSALASALNLPVHRQHNARGDALTTAQVFLALVSTFDRESPQTIGTLTARGAASNPSLLRRVLRR